MADALSDGLAEMNLGVWPKRELKQQLAELNNCAVKKGKSYIYQLWKSLLHQWFSNERCEVYIVTPFLDSKRLSDVCQLMLDFRDVANLGCFYVRKKCNYTEDISAMMKTVLGDFDTKKDKKYIEENVFPNIKIAKKTFHAKFIASVKRSEAEVLVTSANFEAHHFDCENLDTVFYQKMPKKSFLDGMIASIDPGEKFARNPRGS